MLSERERRALTGIEQRIAAQDPRFAATMRRGQRDALLGYDVVVALAGAIALLCFVLALPGPGLVAALVAAAAFWCRPRLPPLRQPGRAVDRGGAHR